MNFKSNGAKMLSDLVKHVFNSKTSLGYLLTPGSWEDGADQPRN